jgi:hypothetical protein
MKYHITQEQFEQLHRDMDKVRSTSKTVTVSKEALRRLLLDHADYAAIKETYGRSPGMKVLSETKTTVEDLV